MSILFIPNSLCSGFTAMSPMAVVQLGFAMSRFPLHAPPLISGMTSGTGEGG
jgi:hypothetical protein